MLMIDVYYDRNFQKIHLHYLKYTGFVIIKLLYFCIHVICLDRPLSYLCTDLLQIFNKSMDLDNIVMQVSIKRKSHFFIQFCITSGEL